MNASTALHATVAAVSAGAAATINWAYQQGSRRLGAVDLFGCEISAICRVCLIVNFAQESISAISQQPHGVARLQQDGKSSTVSDWTTQFTSAEHYTPVYDKNLAHLEALDINAVSFVTQFYSYRMTMMDFMRRVAVTTEPATRLQFMEQMIYMQYLMYESARNAVNELVEFQPNQAEGFVIILCSELTLYRFLLKTYPDDDYRTRRLHLRIDDYAILVPKILDKMARLKDATHWKKARAIGPELVARYEKLRSDLPRHCPRLPELTSHQKIG
jgi:hypothetical protein